MTGDRTSKSQGWSTLEVPGDRMIKRPLTGLLRHRMSTGRPDDVQRESSIPTPGASVESHPDVEPASVPRGAPTCYGPSVESSSSPSLSRRRTTSIAHSSGMPSATRS